MDTPADNRPAEGERTARRGSYRTGFVFGTLNFLARGTLGVVSAIAVSRAYGIRIIGEFALVSAPIGVLWVLSTIREQQALIREITGLSPRDPRVSQLFAAVFTFSVGLTAAVSLLDAAVCWFVFPGPLHEPGLLAPTFVSIAGYAVVTNTGWNLDSIFAAFVAGRQLFWVGLHETLSFIAIALSISVAWHSVWGLVIATIGASLTALVHRVLAVKPFIRWRVSAAEYRLGLRVLPDLLRFGLKATPGQIAGAAGQLGGVWAVGIVGSVTLVGAYSRALTLPQRLQQVSMRITEVLYPTLVGRHTKGEVEGFDRALIDSIRYEAIGMLLIAAVVGGTAHAILEVFGPGFSRATTALALLILFPAMASITITQTQALWAINRPGLTSFVAMLRLAVTVALLVVLTPAVGISGPAIALLVGYVVAIVLSGLALRPALHRPLRATWPVRERLALVGAYAGGFATSHAIEHALPSLAALPLSVAAGALVYLAIFVAAGAVNARDRHRLADALELAGSRATYVRRRAPRALRRDRSDRLTLR
jgi:O-antigen/teichoic acid export membrane protein